MFVCVREETRWWRLGKKLWIFLVHGIPVEEQKFGLFLVHALLFAKKIRTFLGPNVVDFLCSFF